MRGVRMATLLCALTASLCAIVGTLAQNAKRGAVTTSDATAGLEAFGRKKNGGRSLAELVEHMTGDKLVLWGWYAGAGRAPPPLSIADLKLALDTWVKAGAPCPD